MLGDTANAFKEGVEGQPAPEAAADAALPAPDAPDALPAPDAPPVAPPADKA
jgi:hypothetical protein